MGFFDDALGTVLNPVANLGRGIIGEAYGGVRTVISDAGSGALNVFKDVLKTVRQNLSDLLSSPIILIGAAVVILILLKK